MIDKLKVTFLVDNTGSDLLSGEWGLSVWIDDGAEIILLDVGASSLFACNADKLGLNVCDVDYAVLSHAHYDHAGGMKEFFDRNDKACFFLRDTTAENCYSQKFLYRKYIGMPKSIMQTYADRIVTVSDDFRLTENVYLIPHHTMGLEAQGKREKMFKKVRHGWQYDNFSHEQSLVFDTRGGLVIFNSCSHGGAANIIREVSELFPRKKVSGLIGGLHLFNKTDEEIRFFAEEIKRSDVEYIWTGHCTKSHAYDLLKKELGDKVHLFYAGLTLDL